MNSKNRDRILIICYTIVIVSSIVLLCCLVLMLTGLMGWWDETKQKEAEFIELVEEGNKFGAGTEYVRFIDEEGFIQKNKISYMKLNNELEEIRVSYDQVYLFNEPLRIQNVVVEYPSIKALEADN